MSGSHMGIKASASGFPLTTKLNFVGNIGKKSSSSRRPHIHKHTALVSFCDTPLQLSCEMHVTVEAGRGQKSKDLAGWVQI
jgi:hypothetical protein